MYGALSFCIFNSVALAAKMAKQKYAKKRVFIFDWDVHHGNGIQSVSPLSLIQTL